MQVAGVLVVFDIKSDPTTILRSVLSPLRRLVVVDNSSDGHPALGGWLNDPRISFIHHRNSGGLAGAYNAALQWLEQYAPETTHVVFIDEDSEAAVLRAFLDDTCVASKLTDESTASVAPAHRDRATGLRARHMLLQRWRWHYLPREVRGLHKVAFIINSMSVWRIDALRRIGAYNEFLGVDHVDTEYCLRARSLGLGVYLHGDYEFAQSIGRRRAYRLLGHELQSGGHDPARRFSIGRSTAILCRTSLLTEPAFALLCAARLLYEAVGIAIVEPDKWRKAVALAQGAIRGFVGYRKQ